MVALQLQCACRSRYRALRSCRATWPRQPGCEPGGVGCSETARRCCCRLRRCRWSWTAQRRRRARAASSSGLTARARPPLVPLSIIYIQYSIISSSACPPYVRTYVPLLVQAWVPDPFWRESSRVDGASRESSRVGFNSWRRGVSRVGYTTNTTDFGFRFMLNLGFSNRRGFEVSSSSGGQARGGDGWLSLSGIASFRPPALHVAVIIRVNLQLLRLLHLLHLLHLLFASDASASSTGSSAGASTRGSACSAMCLVCAASAARSAHQVGSSRVESNSRRKKAGRVRVDGYTRVLPGYTRPGYPSLLRCAFTLSRSGGFVPALASPPRLLS